MRVKGLNTGKSCKAFTIMSETWYVIIIIYYWFCCYWKSLLVSVTIKEDSSIFPKLSFTSTLNFLPKSSLRNQPTLLLISLVIFFFNLLDTLIVLFQNVKSSSSSLILLDFSNFLPEKGWWKQFTRCSHCRELKINNQTDEKSVWFLFLLCAGSS